jgi:hypothetical protein
MRPALFEKNTPACEAENTLASDRRDLRIFKLRRVLSWAWLVPLLIIILSLGHSWLTYVPPQHLVGQSHSASNSGNLEGDSSTHPKATQVQPRTASTPDYASDLRDTEEIFFPLAGVLLSITLLEQEWKQGTIVQLALRRSLRKVLYQRLGIVVSYLIALCMVGAVVTLLFTIQPPDQGNFFQWIWDMLLTAVPSMLLLLALALLVAHLSKSVIAGYIVALSFWAANYWFVLSLQVGKILVPYTLFGWSNRTLAVVPDNWVWGKLIWFIVALLFLLAQFPLLRNESRLFRYSGE